MEETMKTHRLYRKHYRVILKPGVNYVPIEILRYCGILPRTNPTNDHQIDTTHCLMMRVAEEKEP